MIDDLFFQCNFVGSSLVSWEKEKKIKGWLNLEGIERQEEIVGLQKSLEAKVWKPLIW